eukprot:9492198-Pyramimonas_sp.AAC.1
MEGPDDGEADEQRQREAEGDDCGAAPRSASSPARWRPPGNWTHCMANESKRTTPACGDLGT